MMIIRKMMIDDLPEVSSLSSQLGYPGDLDELKQRFEIISSRPDTALFVADFNHKTNHKIVGWVYGGLVIPLTSKPRAQIWGLVVDESTRKKGIGRLLVSECEKWAKESLAVKAIGVGSNQNRIESHLFYKKLRYAEKKRWIIYEKSLS